MQNSAKRSAGMERGGKRLPAIVRVIDTLSRSFSILAALGGVLLIANVFVDVVGRKFFNSPVPGTIEHTTYWWMPVLVLLAFGLAELKQEHIKVTMLLDALELRTRQIIEGVFGLIATMLLIALIVYTWEGAIKSFGYREITSSSPPVAIWPGKFIAVAGIAMLALQGAATTFRCFAGLLPRLHVAGKAAVAASASGTGADADRGQRPGSRRLATLVFATAVILAVALGSAMLFADLPKFTVGLGVVFLTIILLLTGIPVGIAMLGSALFGLWAISGTRVVESTMRSVAFEAASSWSYSVIPMFILMGMILWKSGLTASAFETTRRWLGWLPGGLAVATNFAGAGLAASSGSTIGITYALGRVSIPEMLKSNYHPGLAVGSVAAAGTLGQIIPPSLLLVVYAGAASVPIGPQLLAGLVPGLILAAAFATVIVGITAVRPAFAPRVDMTSVTWRMRMTSLVEILPITVVVIVVIWGLFSGFFTATEAGVFGALTALFFGVIHMGRGRMGWRAIGGMIRESLAGMLISSASVFLLILGVHALTRAMALSQVPNELAEFIVDMGLGRIELLLILILVYLLLGMFMDTLAMMLLTIPVLLAPLEAVGVDPLWFGVFLVIMAEVGLLTPPLGILSFIVHRIASDPAANLGNPIPLSTVFKGVIPFALTAMAVLLVLIAFPEIVMWLPDASMNR